MIEIPFQAGGPLPSNSPVYIERTADRTVLRHLQQMQYVQLTEPRQQGKTSLIYRLRSTLGRGGYILAYVDAESLKSKNEADWYQGLTMRLANQLQNTVKWDQLSIPTDASTWRSFLLELVTSAPGIRLIIVLDEVGSVPISWAEDFFCVLREIYNVREFETSFQRLSFVLIGAFDPRDLIRDANISPFNVAQRVKIVDFTPIQVKTLVSQLALPSDQIESIAQQLYYWTNGQPYLTQKLCLYLAESRAEITPDTVNVAVDHFFQDDINHLPRIFKDLEVDSTLLGYVHQIITDQPRFVPVINPRHFRLAHVIGVIKPDEQGYCRIRNRIYETALRDADLFGSSEISVAPTGSSGVSVISQEKWITLSSLTV